MARVQREVVVQAPADTVYQVWRNFENFPQLMSNIEEVRDEADGRSHWKARGPLGADAEWDAEITRDEPGRAIEWRSLESEESSVRTQGCVEFESMGDATRIIVDLTYEAPGGALGDVVTKIFANPDRQVAEDLERFRQRIEGGGEYMRTTEKIVGANTSDAESRAVRERYPANEYEGETKRD